MKPRLCHHCGQPLPEIRLGVRLTSFKARIYDIVMRAGVDGISSRDLFDMIYPDGGDFSRETLKAHIWQINDRIRDEGYAIKGLDGYYRLTKTAPAAVYHTKKQADASL